MKVDLINERMTINLGALIEQGGSSIDVYIPNAICERIKDKPLKGIFCSYPIYKDGECFELECEVNPQMGVSFFGKTEYWCRLSNLILPMGLKLKELYDNMTEGMECYHTLYSLWVEELVVDTDEMTITMSLGS